MSTRKVLASLGRGPAADLLKIARPTFEAYAKRFGYDIDTRGEAASFGRPLSWAKVPIIQDLMRSYDVVLWVDADAVIVNGDRDIADELPRTAFVGMVEHRYGRNRVPNCGVMVIRSTPAAHAFWSSVWGRTDYIDHPWWENAAVLAELGYRLPTWPRRQADTLRDWPWRHSLRHVAWHVQCRAKDHLGLDILPVAPGRQTLGGVALLGTEWNSIDADPSPEPRIKHYAGMGHAERVLAMSTDMATIDMPT